METMRLTKAGIRVLDSRTIYCVRNPVALFNYFGKENLQLIEMPPKTLLSELKRANIDYVPSFFIVQEDSAFVIDAVTSILIPGLVACFSCNTLFTYPEQLQQPTIYAREVVQVQDKFYVVVLSDPMLIRAEPLEYTDRQMYVPSPIALLQFTKEQLEQHGYVQLPDEHKVLGTYDSKRRIQAQQE
ncbi:hypothetical protein [Aeromonas veronii]|uniref:hypothetical protein n=1 Tax=Aeromonas veronii TaxID=654 RepID=UPI0036707A0F